LGTQESFRAFGVDFGSDPGLNTFDACNNEKWLLFVRLSILKMLQYLILNKAAWRENQ
jgi:hypothetical protein